MEVEIFIPCFVDQIFADTANNFVKILKSVGCTIHYNRDQTCCGQMMYNTGYVEKTKDLATKFLKDFDNDRIIVAPCASCPGFIRRNYKKIFAGTDLENKAENVASRIYEMSDFLVNKLKIDTIAAEFPHKVTFHDSCSALREYGIKQEPRTLLKNVKGLELIEMEDCDTCCGFGGTFSIKQTAISSAMVQQKVNFAIETGAEYIVSTEPSCLMNIGGYISRQNLQIKAVHLADILANNL